jgi:Holliday junction resolvase RusA-like endonuclease
MKPYAEDRNHIDFPFWLVANLFYAQEEYNKKNSITSFDLDNCVKAIADNLQATKIIKDDRLMMGCTATKQLSVEDYSVVKIFGVTNEH